MSVLLTNDGGFLPASLKDGKVYMHISKDIVIELYNIPELSNYVAECQVNIIEFEFSDIISVLNAVDLIDGRKYILVLRMSEYVTVIDQASNRFYKEIVLKEPFSYKYARLGTSFLETATNNLVEIGVTIVYSDLILLYYKTTSILLNYPCNDYFNLVLSIPNSGKVKIKKRDGSSPIQYSDYAIHNMGGASYASGCFI